MKGLSDGSGQLEGDSGELDQMLSVALNAVDTAGAVIRKHFRTRLEATTKGDESPVTIADRESEESIRRIILAAFPDHGVLGEEFGLDNAESDYRWVLDPIDGTRAFITGRPFFGILVALLYKGAPVLGIIDQPILGERWIGARGSETIFQSSFGGTAGCRPCPKISDAELSCTSPEMIAPADKSNWNSLAKAANRVSWGGDCYAYGLLALGQIDIVAEGDLKIWDWAAIQPIVEGAGGLITDWEGLPLNELSDGRVLAVGDPALLPQALKLLGSGAPA